MTPEQIERKRAYHRAYQRVYSKTEAGKASLRRYSRSEKNKARERLRDQTPERKAYKYSYNHSKRGKTALKRYRQTAKGKAKRHSYKNSEKYKTWEFFYNRSDKGKASYLRYNKTEKGQARVRRARAARYAQPDGVSVAQWKSILEYYSYHCVYCWRDDLKLTQDHYIPLSKGGTHSPDNIVPACKPCNSKKHSRLPDKLFS